LNYQEIIGRRRALLIEPYKSLAEVGFYGSWVTPYQITSKSSEGPVLVALHWLDESAILRERATLQDLGYLPHIRFNAVIDAALARQGMSRSDIYVTQTFHLVPRNRSERISLAAIRRSFEEVTRFELQGRRVIALGDVAAGECARHKIEHAAVCHPSRRGFTNEKNCDRDRRGDSCGRFWVTPSRRLGHRMTGRSDSHNGRLWNAAVGTKLACHPVNGCPLTRVKWTRRGDRFWSVHGPEPDMRPSRTAFPMV
jgi:hypothetical protein